MMTMAAMVLRELRKSGVSLFSKICSVTSGDDDHYIFSEGSGMHTPSAPSPRKMGSPCKVSGKIPSAARLSAMIRSTMVALGL